MTSFRPNWKGWAAMANGPEARAIVRAEAERAMAIAKGLAAEFTDLTDDDKKHYIDSFSIEETTVGPEEHFKRPRAAARLVNDSDHAVAIEFGNKHVKRPHRTLRKTLDAMGGE